MQWIRFSQYYLPPQGLKIVCFRQGDLWIARRIHYKGVDYWIEIPYGGQSGSIATDPPDYWMKLELPEGCTGLMKIGIEGSEPMTLDELQKDYPDDHRDFASMWIHKLDDQRQKIT